MWSQEEKSQLAMLPLLLEWDCRAAAAGDGMAGARFTAVTVKLDGDSCREGVHLSAWRYKVQWQARDAGDRTTLNGASVTAAVRSPGCRKPPLVEICLRKILC
jgi:hypothetical protein